MNDYEVVLDEEKIMTYSSIKLELRNNIFFYGKTTLATVTNMVASDNDLKSTIC